MSAASGAAGGAGLDVDECFSCHLYDGNGSTQTITNGIDLSGEGGLVWIKNRTRSSGADHVLVDTERGANYWLMSSSTSAQFQVTGALTSFNSNGFSQNNNHAETNLSGEDFVSWTFRKAPKFFDVQTVTTDSSGNATVNHNLGSSPGFVIVKGLNVSDAWYCFHTDRGVGKFTNLNTTDAESSSTIWSNVSSTTFGLAFGSGSYANKDMVLYLFAHNNSDGEFGPNSDQDIIKCGSFSTDSSGNATVDVGFEPQWVMVKSTGTGSWEIYDKMRGFTVNGHKMLFPNLSNAEGNNTSAGNTQPTSTGFSIGGNYWGANKTLIYMAIRRGPLAEPENATDVFAIDSAQSTSGSGPAFISNFVTDFVISRKPSTTNNWLASARLLGHSELKLNTTDAEGTNSAFNYDYMNGAWDPFTATPAFQAWMWKRAPSYFDVVAYTGTGSAGTHNHNLTVVPEMIWVKNRDGSGNWFVYHSALGATKGIYLNDSGTGATSPFFWNDTAPTASVFSVGASLNQASAHVAYLFATVAGVSKVGSYTGSNSDQTIDCGFQNGARFVLCKAIDDVQNWVLWDSARGIVTSSEPYLVLDRSDAEITGQDRIDPHSSGFTLTGGFSGANQAGYNFIFYAIA